MKIAEKIKSVLRVNQEVIHNRARIRAMYYLEKQHPKKYHIMKGVINGVLRLALGELDNDQDYSIETVTCLPLTEYRDGGYKNL